MCLIDTVYSSQIHGNASVNVVYNVEFAYIFFLYSKILEK